MSNPAQREQCIELRNMALDLIAGMRAGDTVGVNKAILYRGQWDTPNHVGESELGTRKGHVDNGIWAGANSPSGMLALAKFTAHETAHIYNNYRHRNADSIATATGVQGDYSHDNYFKYLHTTKQSDSCLK